MIDRADTFLRANARLLDRLRFAHHFRNGAPGRVIDALRPYRNADGGFGHALEPDLRGPESQPVPVEVALFVMDEVGTLDRDLVDGCLSYLETITGPDGGVPWVLPSSGPNGPWWNTEAGRPGSLNPTASIAGLLLKNRIDHPWTGRATEFCWSALGRLTTPGAYDLRCVLRFLENVPDRARARSAWATLGDSLRDVVDLDPDAEGDRHGPLDFAPAPHSLARANFPADVIDLHLDALLRQQKPDGGWDFTFESWTPITRPEWRGWVTVNALLLLRDNGRLGRARP